SYFNGPGISRCCGSDFSPSSPCTSKPTLARQRRHSPFGPTCVSGRPQVPHVPITLRSTSATSCSTLMPSVFATPTKAPRRHLPDQKRCLLLPSSVLPGNAGANAKARCAKWQSGFLVEPRLLLDLAARSLHRQRTVLALQTVPFCPPPQTHFPDAATRVSLCSTPKPNHSNANR